MPDRAFIQEKSHQFLEYRDVDVHFIYSFFWKSTVTMRRDLFNKGLPFTRGKSGWISPLLHERTIGRIGLETLEESWVGSYQPTFVMERRFLELSGDFLDMKFRASSGTWLVVPLESGAQLPSKGETVSPEPCLENGRIATYPIWISWTLRLFDTGSGTITVRVSPRNLQSLDDFSTRFCLIHWLLRLGPNMDCFPEAHNARGLVPEAIRPVVDSFLFTPYLGTCRLHDVMKFHRDSGLASLPTEIFVRGDSHQTGAGVYADDTILAYRAEDEKPQEALPRHPKMPETYKKYTGSIFHENQAPFVFATAVLSPESMERLHTDANMATAKELASIYGRMTLDNRRVCQDYACFGDDYLAEVLGFDNGRKRLRNLCLDDRVLFTLSRRGAIAVTASPGESPAVFVIPSLLNLLEILRARLHSGITLGVRLLDLAGRLATLDTSVGEPIDPVEYAHLRNSVVLNLQNPLEYLFDGGSATELALQGEKAFFLSEVWANVRQSFNVVDRLMTAWEATRFRMRYAP